MDSFTKAQCSNIFEEIMNSDLAHCIDEFFKSDENYELIFPLSNIRNKIQKNKYKTVNDFIKDVNVIFLKAAKGLGMDTGISLIIQTLLKQFLEEIQSLASINSTDFKSKIYQFSEDIHSILPKFPDSLHELQLTLDKTETKQLMEEYYSTFTEKEFDRKEINVGSLYNSLKKLSSDQDVTSVVDMITRYELISTGQDDEFLEVDLSKIKPYTLQRLQDFVDSKETKETKPNKQKKHKNEK